MVRAEILKDQSGRIKGFSLAGHAGGYSKSGDDIVCAAVSILAQNTVNSISQLTDAQVDLEYDDAGGYMRALLSNIEESKDTDADLLLKSFELGITGIEKEYKKYIRVSYRRC